MLILSFIVNVRSSSLFQLCLGLFGESFSITNLSSPAAVNVSRLVRTLHNDNYLMHGHFRKNKLGLVYRRNVYLSAMFSNSIVQDTNSQTAKALFRQVSSKS